MPRSTRPATLSRRALALGIPAAAAARLAAQTATAPVYDALDLGTLAGYDGIKAIAVNQRGQVTGNMANLFTRANEAFIWTPGGTGGPPDNPQLRPLGNLSGRPDWLYNGSMASALNFNGQAVGWADGTGRLVDHAHACLWQVDGTPIDMGTLMAGDAMESMATGINNIGKAVGWSDTDYGTLVWFKRRRAFIYDIPARRMSDLGVTQSEANAINDWNEIVGAYRPAEGVEHAAYWDRNGRPWDLHDWVTAGGPSSKATAINDRGQIVGWADDTESGNHRGFFCDLRTGVVKHAAVPDVYGMRQSRIYAINNRGLAVGTYRASTTGYRALLWYVDTGDLDDLNNRLSPEQQWPKAEWPHRESGWLLWEAWGINDLGEIVGQGNRSIAGDYRERSFRLTPKPAAGR